MPQLNSPAAVASWLQGNARVIERPHGFKIGPLTARQANFALSAAKGCSTAQLQDPELEVPALNYVARLGAEHRAAVRKYLAAEAAHRSFAARHDDDDPAHGEHQQRVATARATMAAAELAVVNAERMLAQLRGESV